LEQTAERRPRPRIEELADLIFGLSLSIGSVVLVVNSPVSTGEIGSHIAAFMFTFLILITAWIIYTTDMSVLPLETRAITFLNVGMLLLVALVPYLLNSTEVTNPSLSAAQASAIKDFASTLFALDLGGVILILAGFAHLISVEERKLVAPDLARLFRNGRNRMLIISAMMFVSIAPQFWQWTLFGFPLRLYIWYIPLVSYWVGMVFDPESRTYTLRRGVQTKLS
jgi:uncharacterized membrane protein